MSNSTYIDPTNGKQLAATDPRTAEKFETRSKRAGARVFVVRCCNWSTGDLTEEGRDAALARHEAEFHECSCPEGWFTGMGSWRSTRNPLHTQTCSWYGSVGDS